MAVEINFSFFLPRLIAHFQEIVNGMKHLLQIVFCLILVKTLIIFDQLDEIEQLKNKLEGNLSSYLALYMLSDEFSDTLVDGVKTFFYFFALLEGFVFYSY